MKRYWALSLAAATFFGTACIEESDGLLFITISTVPPDTTFESTVRLTGQAVRTPPRQDVLLIVTVTGGEISVADTATLQGGFFDITVPLNTSVGDTTENNLVATASDGLGSANPIPWEKTVVQIDTTVVPQSLSGNH